MSYDVRVYCVLPFEVDASTSGRGWAISALPSVKVETEDVPAEVTPLLPGIAHLVELSLSPVGAPAVGMTALRALARRISKERRGVILDPQQDTVETAAGVARYAKPVREKGERVAILQMSWWFEGDALASREGIARLLDAIALHLPEAMPRRYGAFEPPQHQLERDGRAHLEDFLARNLSQAVLYPSLPARHVSLSYRPPAEAHANRLGYRSNRLTIDLDHASLDQPGWPEAYQRAFRALSVVVQPFYGEVRTLRGYVHRGATLHMDAASEQEPVLGWWWKGIPPLGHAVVVGAPYRALWPELEAHGIEESGLRLVTSPDWRTSLLSIPVPARLAMPAATSSTRPPSSRRPAEVFPFMREQ